MHHEGNFEGPPTIWVFLSTVGGILTGVGLILGLEYLSDRWSPDSSFLLPHREAIARNYDSSSSGAIAVAALAKRL